MAEDGIVVSGALAYLVLHGDASEEARFLCASETFSTGRSPEFAEAHLCTSDDLVLPVVVRGRPFGRRYADLADGSFLGSGAYIVIESAQSPPGQGHPLLLAVGTGGDAALVGSMWLSGFPIAGDISSGALASSVPAQSPFFLASTTKPELSVFLIAGPLEGRPLRYGEPFQMLSFCGYLCRSRSRPDRLEMRLDMMGTAGEPCYWKLIPHASFYTSFAPGHCLAHAPNPATLLALSCAAGKRDDGGSSGSRAAQRCTVSGRGVFFSNADCEENGDDEPQA